MHKTKAAIVGILALFAVASASAQQFPVVPDRTVIGRVGVGGQSGPSQAIPFATFFTQLGAVSATLPLISGNVAIFDGTTGKIKDSGGPAPFVSPQVFSPSGIASGHVIPWLDENVQHQSNGITPFGIFNTNPVIIGASASVIGSSTVGQTFSVQFTSAGLTGSPITATYTAIGGDTTATIAAGLCTAINANPILHIPTTELPVFCQSFAGSATFNIQWSAALAPSGATPLTLASTGTGTINLHATVDQLDYTVIQVARLATGRTTPQNADNLNCFVFTGASTAGFDTQYAQMCVNSPLVTSGAQQGLIQFNAASGSNVARAIFYAQKGLVLFDASHVQATAGDEGFGTINIPGTGGYYMAGLPVIGTAGIITPANNVFGGIAAGSGLNLQSTQNGAPVADFVQISTGGAIREKIFSAGGVAFGGAADPGAPGIINVSSGYRIGNVALAASNLSNGTTGSGAVVLATSPTILTSLTVAGSALSNTSTGGVGYTTGAGGAVTQLTSRTTGVTLNTVSGAITLFAAAPVVNTWSSFTVTDSAVAATDTINLSVKSANATNKYNAIITAVGAGSFEISFASMVGTNSDSPVINFAVVKAVAN